MGKGLQSWVGGAFLRFDSPGEGGRPGELRWPHPEFYKATTQSQAIELDERWMVPGCPILLAWNGLPGPEPLPLSPSHGPGGAWAPGCWSLLSEAVAFHLSRPRFRFFPRDLVTGQAPEHGTQ